jgi:hypothetical protein
VDGGQHCFATTVREMAAVMPQHKITVQTMQHFLHGRYGGPYDVVYFRGWWGNLRRPPAAPWITTITTDGPTAETRLVGARMLRRHGMAAVVVQCSSVLRIAMHLNLPAVAMIPNGVNIDTFRPGDIPGKGVGLAAKLVGSDRRSAKGCGLLEMAVKELGLEPRVVSDIPHEEIAPWYRGLWAYCQPSAREGCSNSTFEAMASGLPCLICKDVGYHGEACTDARLHPGGNVLFVERTVASVQEALRQLVADPALHARVSANARRFAEAHAWPIVAKRFDQLFRFAAGQDILPDGKKGGK